ncbi:MAG: hypothetical protein ABUT39_24570 [Acidobacteriota bacterium]
MGKRILLFLVTPLALALLLAAAPVGGEILVTGAFHGEEVTARSGETWLCLMATKTGDELKTCTIDVKAAHDVIAGDDSGKEVTVRGGGEPILMVRNIAGLKPGPVRTFFLGMAALRPENTLHLGSEEGELWLAEEKEGYSIAFSKGPNGFKAPQILRADTYDSDGPPTLHWAGDLDRDGKLDLVIDITNHYNLSRMALFLSSLAKEGELVGLAGFFDSGGC